MLPLIVLGVLLSLGAFFTYVVLRRLLFVAEPNEALIFAGASRVLPGRRAVGYRTVRGGRGVRKPLLEVVHRLDLTMFTIDVVVQNAYSRGGIPLNVVGVANVKIAGEEPLIDNAIERFLGKPRHEVMRIAKETLEGNLRGVLAQLTPEQVNEDKISFAHTLIEEAEHDMSRMGLSLETLKIQNVSDDVGYLGSIGRVRGAVVRRDAAIAEARTKAEATVRRFGTTMGSELKKIDADLEIAREDMNKRVTDARSRREALIAEAYGQVSAQIATTRAEIERQKARFAQVKNQLEAEVVAPAEAQQRSAEERARGEASRIIEQARAQAASLRAVIEELRKAGPQGREILVLQKLLPLAGAVAGVGHALDVKKLTVLPRDNGSLAKQLVSGNEQVRAVTGVNLAEVARRVAGRDEG